MLIIIYPVTVVSNGTICIEILTHSTIAGLIGLNVETVPLKCYYFKYEKGFIIRRKAYRNGSFG